MSAFFNEILKLWKQFRLIEMYRYNCPGKQIDLNTKENYGRKDTTGSWVWMKWGGDALPVL